MSDARLTTARTEALSLAESELRELGFKELRARVWVGALSNASGHSCRVRVSIPVGFPDVLPEIHLDDSPTAPLAHIDSAQKICIAPETGVLLDVTRPAALVRDTVERARVVLALSADQHRLDRLTEFNAYWSALEGGTKLHSICPVPLETGEVVICNMADSPSLRLVASTRDDAVRWATRVGRRVSETRPAYALGLSGVFDPPLYNQRLTIRDVRRQLAASTAPEVVKEFEEWLENVGIPATVVLSQRVPPQDDDVVFAFHLARAQSAFAQKGDHGFRKGRAPMRRQLAFASGDAVQRWIVHRVDPEFLVRRGGGDSALLASRVAIVGCGAVGSQIVTALAATGVGALHLIDPEQLSPANLQRHVLGAADLNRLKVDGLRRLIQAKHPHVDVTVDPRSILDVLNDDASSAALREYSAVILAVGNETVELRVNDLLRDAVPRLHVWLEAFGLSGHYLTTGFTGRPGCYGCLFRSDPVYGFVNMSALAAPGQNLQRTFGGCPGVYTPFGFADAQRAAAEVSPEIVRRLLGEGEPGLVSWQTSRAAFESSGGILSDRGRSFTSGCLRVYPLSGTPCAYCATWKE